MMRRLADDCNCGSLLDTMLIEGSDYYFNELGLMVFTADYLKRRGYCCQNGCRHCPYGFVPVSTETHRPGLGEDNEEGPSGSG